MTVTRADLETFLASLSRDVADPRQGLFGEASATWLVNREAIVFLGGARAALLQLAHPYVAQAIEDHSQTRAAPASRFLRTFERVFAMVFGDLDAALDASRRVHSLHTTITGELPRATGRFARGHRYQANEEEALLWVHATLFDSSVQAFELFVRPLTLEEKFRYYDESRRFTALFGIPREILPASFEEHRVRFDAMIASDTIVPSFEAKTIAHFLLAPPTPIVAPLTHWTRALTAGLMPPRLRVAFELPFGPVERAIFAASIPAIRSLRARAPASLTTLPAYREAMRRVRGEREVPIVDRALIGLQHALERHAASASRPRAVTG
ncbi:MAG: oxygenase MpaB family protein [Polyangiales bacterium]